MEALSSNIIVFANSSLESRLTLLYAELSLPESPKKYGITDVSSTLRKIRTLLDSAIVLGC